VVGCLQQGLDRAAKQGGIGPATERINVGNEPVGRDRDVVVCPHDVIADCLDGRPVARMRQAWCGFECPADRQTVLVRSNHLVGRIGAVVVDDENLPLRCGRNSKPCKALERLSQGTAAIPRADRDRNPQRTRHYRRMFKHGGSEEQATTAPDELEPNDPRGVPRSSARYVDCLPPRVEESATAAYLADESVCAQGEACRLGVQPDGFRASRDAFDRSHTASVVRSGDSKTE